MSLNIGAVSIVLTWCVSSNWPENCPMSLPGLAGLTVTESDIVVRMVTTQHPDTLSQELS